VAALFVGRNRIRCHTHTVSSLPEANVACQMWDGLLQWRTSTGTVALTAASGTATSDSVLPSRPSCQHIPAAWPARSSTSSGSSARSSWWTASGELPCFAGTQYRTMCSCLLVGPLMVPTNWPCRFQNPRCKHYFLTHQHSDHTTGEPYLHSLTVLSSMRCCC
jgi:hypothetical protein